MSEILLLMLMVVMHTIEDFHLQGIMAQMKQKSWWKAQEGYTEKYRNDYVPVLLLHGFEWAVLTSLPILLLEPVTDWFCVLVVGMGLIHALIDHLKCNRLRLNLVQDQLLHMMQIGIIWLCWMILV